MPQVSVLVPCFNSERFIGRTLDSLRSQTLRDWECIVVDDGSTDGSAEIVQAYAREDGRISLIRTRNGGVSRARNRAYAVSSPASRYVLFLDSDDCLEPSMLSLMTRHLDLHGEVCLAYCAFVCIDDADQLIPANDPRLPESLPTRLVAAGMGIKSLSPAVAETPFASIYAAWAGLLPSNSLLRRSVYATIPGWDESFGQPAEDTDIFLHMALRGRVHYISRPLLRYRRHATQSTADAARLLAQNQKLFQKWARPEGLTDRQRAVVRAAQLFRETRLVPSWWLSFALSHIRSGNVVEAGKCLLRAGRQAGMGLRLLTLAS